MNMEDSIRHRIVNVAEASDIPVVAVVDGGRLYDPLRDALMENHIPVFTVCDKAVAALSLYIQGRLAAEVIRSRDKL